MLRTLIAVAAGSALAKKAWDHYHAAPRARLPDDITELVGRPEAVAPQRKRRSAPKPARREGPAT